MNTPKNIENYKGEFIIFFSNEENPIVLFHTLIAEEAFKKAEEIKLLQKKNPIVIRVSENTGSNVSSVLGMFC